MTLTQTAIITKQIITISIFALILGILSFIGYKIWYSYYLANLPPVEEKPDIKFGLLPYPDFPKAAVSSSNFSYSIDTSTGNLPKVGVDHGFEKLVKVYFVTKTFTTLLSAEKSQNLAEKFDIKIEPKILSETSYQFEQGNKILVVDLDSGNFSFAQEATPSAKENLADDNKLVADFEGILSTLGVFKEGLQKGRSKVMLLKNEAGKLIPTQQRNEAQTAQISLWPTSIESKPILTPQFDTALINAQVFKGASDLKNYLSLDYTYFPIDLSTFATYPIKTTAEAFADLKSGKGVIVIEGEKPNISISSIYLGYYLSDKYSPYLQPIFVFEGPHFVAYVAAISEQFTALPNP